MTDIRELVKNSISIKQRKYLKNLIKIHDIKIHHKGPTNHELA